MNSYWTEAAQLYLILHQSCFSLKSDPQDLLRSFTFTVPQRRNDLHLTSSEDLSVSMALNYMFGSFQSHLIIGHTEWRLIFKSFYVSICCTVIKISLIYITSIRIAYQIAYFAQIIHNMVQAELTAEVSYVCQSNDHFLFKWAEQNKMQCEADYMMRQHIWTTYTVGTESIQTPLNFSLFVILQPFAKII